MKVRRTRRSAGDEQDPHPQRCSFPRGLHLRLRWQYILRLQFKAEGHNSHVELLHVHSPLLWESCLVSRPPLTYMLKFSGFADLTSCLGRWPMCQACLGRNTAWVASQRWKRCCPHNCLNAHEAQEAGGRNVALQSNASGVPTRSRAATTHTSPRRDTHSHGQRTKVATTCG